MVSSSSEAESDQVSPYVWYIHPLYLALHVLQSGSELSEAEADQSDSEAEDAMDTAEHEPQQLT